MTRRKTPNFSEQLAAVTDVDPSVAEVVLATAVDYIKAQHPELSSRVDGLLADRRWTSRAARLIGRLARPFRPRATPRRPTEEW
ncbi:MAG: hypothetical protein JXC32_17900 [Anaerolineae bacterium]|nr:hypothetical protein [Anaerolineae bacterium]